MFTTRDGKNVLLLFAEKNKLSFFIFNQSRLSSVLTFPTYLLRIIFAKNCILAYEVKQIGLLKSHVIGFEIDVNASVVPISLHLYMLNINFLKKL